MGRADTSTLESTLLRIYQADEDEHDDTYDDAEETSAGPANGNSARAVEPVAGDDGASAQIVASRRNKHKDKQVSKAKDEVSEKEENMKRRRRRLRVKRDLHRHQIPKHIN